jgi:hypothetical protein
MSNNNPEHEVINQIIISSSLKRKRDINACWLTPEEQQERDKEEKQKTKKQREEPLKPKKKKKSNKEKLKEKFGF